MTGEQANISWRLDDDGSAHERCKNEPRPLFAVVLSTDGELEVSDVGDDDDQRSALLSAYV